MTTVFSNLGSKNIAFATILFISTHSRPLLIISNNACCSAQLVSVAGNLFLIEYCNPLIRGIINDVTQAKDPLNHVHCLRMSLKKLVNNIHMTRTLGNIQEKERLRTSRIHDSRK